MMTTVTTHGAIALGDHIFPLNPMTPQQGLIMQISESIPEERA
jgi:hypothetical protein